MLSPEYVAGLFDGEGTASLLYTTCRRRNKSDIPILGFKFRVLLSNTYQPIIDLLQQQFGGNIYYGTPRERCKQIRIWSSQSSVAQRDFLTFIRPHVIIKHGHVECGLRFLSTVVGRGQRTLPGAWDIRLDCYKTLQTLNRRGEVKTEKHVPPSAAPDGWRPSARHTPEELKKVMEHVRAGCKP